jgi:Flp pilus assembly protein TadG
VNRRHIDREAGQVTALWAVLALALLVLGGVVYDGGQILTARRHAHNLASQAARAGAQAFDVDAVLAGTAALDPVAAEAAARDFLRARGVTGNVTVTSTSIEVTVTLDQQTPLLSLVGISDRTVSGTARAGLVRGIRDQEP